MEVPYIVEPRKDTGLFNAKIGIWLFLASEVMLFGGLFSAYVFLRIGADFPWPERTLPIVPGLINTFVLIASSVAVVMAWACLKLRKKQAFNLWMAFTIVCAGIFMGLKAIEYNSKFHHNAARLADFTVVEGHVEPGENVLSFDVHGFSFSARRWHGPFFEDIVEQISSGDQSFELTFLSPEAAAKDSLEVEDVIVSGLELHANNPQASFGDGSLAITKLKFLTSDGFVDYDQVKGDSPGSLDPERFDFKLTKKTLKALRQDLREARGVNNKVNAADLRDQWKTAKAQNPNKENFELAGDISVRSEQVASFLRVTTGSVNGFLVDKEGNYAQPDNDLRARLAFKPFRPLFENNQLKDDTRVHGSLIEDKSAMEFHVDGLDFRHLAMRAEEIRKEPMEVIEASWVLNEGDKYGHMRSIWEAHKNWLYGYTDASGKEIKGHVAKLNSKGLEPTPRELYRVEKQDILKYFRGGYPLVASLPQADSSQLADTGGPAADKLPQPSESDLELTFLEKFGVVKNVPLLGGMIPDRHHHYPHLTVPREKVLHESTFTPAWNNYYALYFTLTGLHGLHVVGGALVLGYFWLCGGRMYRENPEWLANRVEVGGLFWHFVDLVWIFLFPILYLM